jgi:hypothetical protein
VQQATGISGGDPDDRLRGVRRHGGRRGELAGITGTLELEIVEGTHRYRLDYDLPAEATAP